MSQPAHAEKNLTLEEKRALAARLLREKAGRPKRHPVSFGQQRLWFMEQLEPGSAAYNMPAALRFRGPLNLPALEASLNEVVRRHEALRTTFANEDGEPVQLVHPPAPRALEVEAVSAPTREERERRAVEIVREQALRPFDLSAGPLLRAHLVRLSADEHIILINLHHIVTDGWSTAILVGELVSLYSAFTRGEPSPLAELPIQYADYARWQRGWMEGEKFEAELRYWREQLGGRLQKLELPTDYPRPPAQDYDGAACVTTLDERLTEALGALSRRAGATLFITLLAAFKTLLHRYTGQEEVALGTPISGRTQAETERLIGFFVNTLVLRTDLSGRPTFLEVIGRVKEVSLGAFANQTMPFEKLVEELQPERHLGKNPLFEIMFNFGSTPRKTVELEELSLSLVELEGHQAKHAVTLYADEAGDRIDLSVVYQRALFAPERMRSLLDQYVYLLEQLAEAPERPIDTYSLRPPGTLRLLPDPREPLPLLPYEPVTEAFARWAESTPAQVAVSHLGRDYTYRQLSDCAGELSRRLVAGGLQPGDTVAVLGPRSFALVACVVATLQTGGVLLLIDRTHPEGRRAQLVREANARHALVVTDDDEEDGGGETAGLPSIRVRSSDGRILGGASAPASVPLFSPRGSDPAYLIFTSGSTGTPKGVLCTHGGLSHFINWEREEFDLRPEDRVAQLSRLSFEVAMRDMFLPLTSGATICLPPDQTEFGPEQMLPWLESEGATIIHIVPAVAEASLMRWTPALKLERLRWTLFAGEALTDHLVGRWRAALSRAGEIANLYGPTETTLAKFWYRVPREPSPGIQPVGRPLPHTQALVINKAGQLCGVGETGEIVIRTPYRSLGYINASQEQRDRFRPNPFRNEPGDTLYYTGDQGRYRADGLLEIQGRIDQQVKLGGVRIELGEIESIIAAHPDVGHCVAAVKGDSQENRRLVAYVIPKEGKAVSVSSLRGKVRRELPRYQHPSHYIFLDRLPLLPNGKVDRGALPEPGTERPETENPYVAPRDEVELKLSKVWEAVLKVSPVGVSDDFFELGGHSLLAVRLMAQIQKTFGRWLPLASLFEGASVEKLAQRLREESDEPCGPLVAIQPAGSRPPLFFVHPAGGNVLCYSELAKRLGAEQPFYALQACGFEEGAEPLSRIEEMASRYVEAVVRTQAEGPYHLGGWSLGAVVAYEMAQQFVARGQEVALLALLDHRPPVGEDGEALDDLSIMRRFLEGYVELDDAALEAMSEEQRLLYLLEQGNKFDLIPPEVGVAQINSYLKVYRANLRALRGYTAAPYPGRVTLLKTRSGAAGEDETYGWGALAGQGVEVFEVPGRHHDMVAEPHVKVLADVLKESLRRARTSW